MHLKISSAKWQPYMTRVPCDTMTQYMLNLIIGNLTLYRKSHHICLSQPCSISQKIKVVCIIKQLRLPEKGMQLASAVGKLSFASNKATWQLVFHQQNWFSCQFMLHRSLHSADTDGLLSIWFTCCIQIMNSFFAPLVMYFIRNYGGDTHLHMLPNHNAIAITRLLHIFATNNFIDYRFTSAFNVHFPCVCQSAHVET